VRSCPGTPHHGMCRILAVSCHLWLYGTLKVPVTLQSRPEDYELGNPEILLTLSLGKCLLSQVINVIAISAYCGVPLYVPMHPTKVEHR
jgi:hypothetical protein